MKNRLFFLILVMVTSIQGAFALSRNGACDSIMKIKIDALPVADLAGVFTKMEACGFDSVDVALLCTPQMLGIKMTENAAIVKTVGDLFIVLREYRNTDEYRHLRKQTVRLPQLLATTVTASNLDGLIQELAEYGINAGVLKRMKQVFEPQKSKHTTLGELLKMATSN